MRSNRAEDKTAAVCRSGSRQKLWSFLAIWAGPRSTIKKIARLAPMIVRNAAVVKDNCAITTAFCAGSKLGRATGDPLLDRIGFTFPVVALLPVLRPKLAYCLDIFGSCRASRVRPLDQGVLTMCYDRRWALALISLTMLLRGGAVASLDGLRQQRSCAVAQHLSQRVAKSSWLGQLQNVSLGHGVSLLRWRSGGFEHPRDTPPSTFDRSSSTPRRSDKSPFCR